MTATPATPPAAGRTTAPPPPAPFDGVVLCGGASRRMGRDKALVEVGGRAMARIAADALLAAGAARVRCVGGDRPALARWGLDVLADRHPGEGPLGALLTAFDDEDRPDRPSLLMVLTCDLPLVDATVVAPVVEALHRRPDAAVAAPFVDGRPQLLSAAYRPAVVRPLARAAFERGERAVRAGLEGLTVVAVDGLDHGRLEDADTPDRLAALSPPRHHAEG